MFKKYQPSNGTEGMYFTDKFCMNCINCNPDPRGKKQCEILLKTLVYDVTSPEYPSEWIYDKNMQGKCTAFNKWDWNKDGDPDDSNNPNYQMPVNPNQTSLEI